MKKKYEQFLELYRCGLWDCEVNTALFTGDVDWQGIIELARNQTVVGNLTDGMGMLPRELHPGKVDYFGMIAMTADIERKNQQMNQFIPKLMTQLEVKGVRSVLLKGQGVAACYRDPLHRQSGDIDLLIPDADEYQKARELMLQIGKEAADEHQERKHSAFEAYGFLIELHGNFRFFISRRCRQNTLAWRQRALPADMIGCRKKDGFTIPPVRFDTVFIFGHLLGHFMGGGIGLRQVGDWMMFLHANRVIDDIHDGVLKDDLELLGLTDYWRAFASMAVCQLGFPRDEMPFYDPGYDRLGKKVLENIFYTGNFGARQKAHQLSQDAHPLVKKAVTLFGQLPVYGRNFGLFPRDTVYCFGGYLWNSFSTLI